jgi:hypothetical protein
MKTVNQLSDALVKDLLLAQADEFAARFAEPNYMLAHVIVETNEATRIASGRSLIGSGDPSRRILGIRLMREVSPEYRVTVSGLLSPMLSSEQDSDVIYWLVSAFSFLGSDAVSRRLRELAQHRSSGVRYGVATALSSCTKLSEESKNALIALARDSDAEVRFSAIFEIGRWWRMSRDPALREELNRARDDSDEAVFRAAVDALKLE